MPLNVVQAKGDPAWGAKYNAVQAADAPFKSALSDYYRAFNGTGKSTLPTAQTDALRQRMESLKGNGFAAAQAQGMNPMSSRAAANMTDSQTPAERGIAPYGSSGGAGFGSGGIGSNPFGGASTMQPRSVATQIFNRPAYQRNRVTTGQMSEMDRANQDRFRAEQRPLTTAFNRSFSQADAQQRMNDTAVNDSASNQFFGLMNGYQQQQNSLNQQQIMPLLSQLFGGF